MFLFPLIHPDNSSSLEHLSTSLSLFNHHLFLRPSQFPRIIAPVDNQREFLPRINRTFSQGLLLFATRNNFLLATSQGSYLVFCLPWNQGNKPFKSLIVGFGTCSSPDRICTSYNKNGLTIILQLSPGLSQTIYHTPDFLLDFLFSGPLDPRTLNFLNRIFSFLGIHYDRPL